MSLAPPNGRAKRWSDADLRTAVAYQHSWRGTARALGLRGHSAGSLRALKRRASELGIDTSHFTSQRRWSDDKLREAVNAANSWAEVLSGLSLSDNAGARTRVRGHAIRLGMDISHLETRAVICEIELAQLVSDLALPRAAKQFASAWFSIRGVPVAKPEHPAAYDLLVTFKGREQRVQVKTTTFRARHGTWVVNIGRRPYLLDKSASREPYDPDELDFFFIIDGDLTVYVIPSRIVAGMTAINVGAYQQFRVGDASSLVSAAP